MTDRSTVTQLCVQVRYALRALWVRPDVLGTSYAWDQDGREVTLVLPSAPEDFTNADETEVPLVPAWVPTAVIGGSGAAAAVQLIRAETTVDAQVSAKQKASIDFDSSDDDEAERARLFARTTQLAFREGLETIEKALRAWLSHIRSQGSQPWLGIVAEMPPQYGRGHVFDIAAGSRLMSFGPEQRATIRSGQVALTAEVLDQIVTRLQAGEGPDVSRSLLADARFLSQEAETRDPQRAVLIAAAAAEIKAKETMREKVPASRAELLDLVLRRVSNLEQLLDGPLPAALDVSLKETNRELYDEVSQLGKLRNRIVHRGEQVEGNEEWRLVMGAQLLFDWLDELESA
jgi:hypothetical protein